MKNLTWDPAKLRCKTPKGNIQFCGYSSKLGHNILQCKNLEKEGISSKQIRNELDYDFLKQYWKQLQATKIAKKIKAFLWLCRHKSLLVGAWLQKRGIDEKCRLCSSGLESLEHCLWECSHAHEVWSKVLRILMKSKLEGSISLEFALWWRLVKKVWRLKAFCVQRVNALYNKSGDHKFSVQIG